MKKETKKREGRGLADIQKMAERIFHHVEKGHLPTGYAVAMGSLIEIYAHNDFVHVWVLSSYPAAVEKLLACMVLHRRWHEENWMVKQIEQSEWAAVSGL